MKKFYTSICKEKRSATILHGTNLQFDKGLTFVQPSSFCFFDLL